MPMTSSCSTTPTSVLLIFLVTIALACCSSSFAQDTISLPFANDATLRVDNNGCFYLHHGNTLMKTIPGGQTLQFSWKLYGDISSVDVSNPHKTLLFFKSRGLCLLTDKYLKELQSPISLENLGLFDVSLVCLGSDNVLWAFDNATATIIKFDNRMNILSRSPDVSRIATFTQPPDLLVERDDRIFLSIPGVGLLLFDNSASYVQTTYLPPFTYVQPLSNSTILYVINDSLPVVYHLPTSTRVSYQPLHRASKTIFYNNGKLYEYFDQYMFVESLVPASRP